MSAFATVLFAVSYGALWWMVWQTNKIANGHEERRAIRDKVINDLQNEREKQWCQYCESCANGTCKYPKPEEKE